ncbi:PREDICTED: protein FAM57A-like [Branchiostoma belcheri]|uniref:Protein FAM57A-like n=1 Tax=Branchiostoma belcheri TaxID=7741 RepID=A0A6P4YAF6_BRABE|nr:PREDICTED: protein FAM57A-like [Branchiostoma belcheri]
MSYVCVRSCLERTWPRLTAAEKAVLTECAVSSLQGVLATWAGVTIVFNCNDVIHWLADWYSGFCLPYFGYDIWAMYQSTSCQLASSGVRLPWATVLTNRGSMVAHHVIIPAIFLPASLLRGGKGDFYVGCFFLYEASTPLTNFRHALSQLNMKETGLYYANGFLILVTFFLWRIAIFPFMLWAYEQQYGLLLSDAPYRLPWKCSAGCAVVMTFQCYWFTKMLQIVHRTIRNKILQQM